MARVRTTIVTAAAASAFAVFAAAQPAPPAASPGPPSLSPPVLTGAALAAKVAEAAKSPLGSRENPIRVNGVAGERAYLDRLRCSDRVPPLYTRTGAFGIGVFGGIVDGYQLACATGSPKDAAVYMDMYHPGHIEGGAPPGFTLVAGATPTAALAVPSIDPRPSAELVEQFKAFCVEGFPDESRLKSAAAARDATALGRADVKPYLHDDAGHGWRFRTALGLYVVTIEESPVQACAIRRMTPSGFTAAQPFAMAVQGAAIAGGGALQAASAQTTTTPEGLKVSAVPIVVLKGGKPAEQFAVFQTAYAGRPPAEFAADAAGGQGVEVRIVRQLLKN